MMASEVGNIRKSVNFRVGKWRQSDTDNLNRYLTDLEANAHSIDNLHPAVKQFRQTVVADPILFMQCEQMFKETPAKHKHHDPTGGAQPKNFDVALGMISKVLTEPPPYNTTGLKGFPINAILDWSMGTPAGLAVFTNCKLNAALKLLLDAWGNFLKSPHSRGSLNYEQHGWFGNLSDGTPKLKDFDDLFQCDPKAEFKGFRSWDDFFVRVFRPGKRPVADPDDDSVVVNACESSPFAIQHNVKDFDQFWIKSQRYSINHMLDNHVDCKKFIGGTVYQAFLSATCYHRWHSPVNGTIKDIVLIPGTYYSEAYYFRDDDSAPNDSQGYLAEVATRALIFIDADNKDIGLMCVVTIGMAEVSTCEVTVTHNQKVRKGDEIGMFHFGGSTHCLLFGPHVNIEEPSFPADMGSDCETIFEVNSKLFKVLDRKD